MGRPVKKGATNQWTILRIIDSTLGTEETAVTAGAAGLSLKYWRFGAGNALTSIVVVNLAALTTSHTDGGLKHIMGGYYRFDCPDAVWATASNEACIVGTCTDMIVMGNVHPLVDYDPQDAVRMGMTALPNAAADAAGGLPISDAGGIDMDDLKADVTAILVDTGTTLDGRIPAALVGGRIDASVGAVANDAITAAAIANGAIDAATFAAGAIDAAAIAAGAIDNATFAADVGSTAHATNIISLAARKGLDDYDPPTKGELDTGLAALNDVTVAEILAGHIEGTTDLSVALQQILAKATGNVTKVGNAYTFADRAGDPLFTLTIDTGAGTVVRT